MFPLLSLKQFTFDPKAKGQTSLVRSWTDLQSQRDSNDFAEELQ